MLELGLLFIATGLAFVLVAGITMLLLLGGPSIQGNWIIVLLGGFALLGFVFLAAVLTRRLHRFLTRPIGLSVAWSI